MLRLLIGKDWKANQEAVLKEISRDIRDRKPGRVLLVPELASHETERALCQWAGDTASRYGEVLSFTRLAKRMTEQGGGGECLDGGGRVVAMAAAARQLSSRLKTYASVETKPEFLLKMIDALDEFKRCCIRPEDLRQASDMASGSLAQKLEELSLLMESYDAVCAQGRRDPRDQMTWLLEKLEEGDYPREHVFYIDGFPDFTRQHLAILECLIRRSPSVTVSLNCDRPGSHLLAFEKAGQTASQLLKIARRAEVEFAVEVVPGRDDPLALLREKLFQGSIPPGALMHCLQTVRASSLWQECLWAAGEAAALAASGCRYRDITVVCADLNRYAPVLNTVFRRMHIPLYQSGTQQILGKSMVSTVLTALDAASGGLDRPAVMAYLRSGLSPMDDDTCDLVENYTYLWGIRGQGWCRTWTSHPDGLNGQPGEEADKRLEKLNRARVAAIGPLEHLRDGLFRANNLREQVLSLYAFLEEVDLERRMEETAKALSAAGEKREAQIFSQLWEILVSALEQLYDVLGDTHWETEHFTRLLRLLLSQYDVGTIPPVLDAVQMGPVSAMRCHRGKHLLVLGAEEGCLPGYSGAAGLLTDQERVAIRALGVPLTGGAMEGISSEFAEIYGVFSGAEETVRVSVSAEQPSFLFRRLAELAGSTGDADTSLDFAGADPWESGAYLAQWNCPEAADRLGVSESYRFIRAQSKASLGKMTPAGVRGLYGASLNLSASQIDTQAGCRLYYYLKYGLRARERKEAAIDPAEFGTYVHAVLEHTVKTVEAEGGFRRISLERTLSIAHEFSDRYGETQFGALASPRVQSVFLRNRRELDMVLEELWQELRSTEFRPKGFEVGFGKEPDQLPPIAIANGAMPAILRGFVDRVDVWESPGSAYYRVVDYKTGRKDFDFCDIFNGVGLQMLLYLFALEHSGAELLGEKPVAAGVQYFPARAPYISLDGTEAEDGAKKREEEWTRKGLLLEDRQVLEAMNPENRKHLTAKCGVASREQMKLLEGYVFRVMARMVEDIASGNVEPNPYCRGLKHDTCRFCPYGGICHKDTVEGRRNYKTMTAQRFWEEIGKEMGSHG